MRFAWLLAVTACAGSPSDVVGPFTGASHRFVIDRMTLPATREEMDMLGDDLDGDGRIDNGIGGTIAFLHGFGDATTHGADMIASGALASEIEILADDLDADDRVAALYHGTPGDQPTPVGGRLSRAGFLPNLTRDTRVPGEAMIRLPIFADADPAVLHVVGLEITLTRDGRGGFDGVVAGGVLVADTADPTFTGVTIAAAAVRPARWARSATPTTIAAATTAARTPGAPASHLDGALASPCAAIMTRSGRGS